MSTLAAQFLELFWGSEIAHGTFIVSKSAGQGKQKGNASVVRQPASLELWQKHLEGVTGIGIIPICIDNSCRWGAIDIDDYTTASCSCDGRANEVRGSPCLALL
jgi:hypothetical protein